MAKETGLKINELGRVQKVGDSTQDREAPYQDPILFTTGTPDGTTDGRPGTLAIDDSVDPPVVYIKGQGLETALTPWTTVGGGGGGGETLQETYDLSAPALIQVDATNGGVIIRDADVSINADLLTVDDGAGTSNFAFAVNAKGGMRAGFFGSGSIGLSGYGAGAIGYTGYYGTILTSGQGSTALGSAFGNSGNIYAQGSGTLAQGYAYDGTLQAAGYGTTVLGHVVSGGQISTSGSGAFASGYATGAGSTITSSGAGAVAGGYAAGGGDIDGPGKGSFAMGRTHGAGLIQASLDGAVAHGRAYEGHILATGYGAMAHGFSYGSTSIISASSNGAFAGGYAYYGGQISAASPGSRAFGTSRDASSFVRTQASGAMAFGEASSAGVVEATGIGAFAGGRSTGTGSYIEAGGQGALAVGNVSGGYRIFANANGSLAFGDASTANIDATAVNSFQFAEGVNAQADSLAVGTSLRLGENAPGTPRNGDIWVAAGYVYIRSNATTRKIDGTDI